MQHILTLSNLISDIIAIAAATTTLTKVAIRHRSNRAGRPKSDS
jgi:hypothetical protein